MHFDLMQLQSAVVAARSGFHAAAHALGLSEGVILQHIAALERRLGYALFVRSGTEVLPALEGARFLLDAEHLLRRTEEDAARLADSDAAIMLDSLDHIPLGPLGTRCACGDRDAHPFELPDDIAAAAAAHRYAALCRAILAARKRIGRAFGMDLFGDPASDMLLDLYLREHDGLATSLTSLWGAAGAAYGTARRALTIMEGRGLITREADPNDGRRTLVRLTVEARRQVEGALDLIHNAAQADSRYAGFSVWPGPE